MNRVIQSHEGLKKLKGEILNMTTYWYVMRCNAHGMFLSNSKTSECMRKTCKVSMLTTTQFSDYNHSWSIDNRALSEGEQDHLSKLLSEPKTYEEYGIIVSKLTDSELMGRVATMDININNKKIGPALASQIVRECKKRYLIA